MATTCIRSSLQTTRLFMCTFRQQLEKTSKLHFSNRYFKLPINDYLLCTNRYFTLNSTKMGTAARAETTSTIQGLSKLQAQELVLRLTSEERSILISALQEYQSKLVKDELEGK